MSKVVKPILWLIVVALLLISLMAFWLLSTENGLRWALKRVPDMLKVDSVSGHARDLKFEGLEVNLEGTTIRIADGSLRWRLRNLLRKQAVVDELALNKVDVTLIEVTEPTPAPVPYIPWQGIELPIDVFVPKVSVTQLSVHTAEQSAMTFSKIKFSAKVENNILALNSLTVSDADNLLSINGLVDLSARPTGVVDLSHSVVWQVDASEVSSQGIIKGTWSSLKLEQNHLSPFPAQLEATVDDALTELISWTAKIRTDPLQDQIVISKALAVSSGEFDLEGQFVTTQGLDGLKVNLVGQIEAGNTEVSQWQMNSDISIENNQLVINQLQLIQQEQPKPTELLVSGQIKDITRFLEPENTSGVIDLKGDWQSLKWPLAQSDAVGSDTQIESNGRFSVTGSRQEMTVLADMDGESYGQLLTAKANVLLAGSTVAVKKLNLTSGQSLLDVTGLVDERLDLKWNFNSPNLGDFIADGSGALTSSGKLTGTQADPRLQLKALSKEISLLGYSVDNLNVLADISLAEEKNALDVKMKIGSVKQEQKTLLENFTLTVDGRASSHNIAINSAVANRATVKVEAHGGLVNEQWSGFLPTLTMDDADLGIWSLQNEVALQVSASEFSVSESCLKNQTQSICLQAEQRMDGVEIQTKLVAIDLATLNRVTKRYDIDIAGQFDGEFSYYKKTQQESGIIEGYVESDSSVLTWKETRGDALSDETLVFDLIRADIKQLDTLQSSFDISLSNADSVKIEVALSAPFESAEFTKAPLKGQADFSIADLSVLPSVLLDSITLNGALQGQVQLAGSLDAPDVMASAQLSDASVDIPELGLELEKIALTVDSKGTSKIGFMGQLQSGEGQLEVNGDADFANLSSPKLSVTLKGQDFQLANTQELNIAGDIDLTVAMADQLLDVQGAVAIDHAELDFKIPETALLASNDVVLEGVEKSATALKQRIKLVVDLGQKTHISAQGLDADLLGKVLVFQEPGGILRGDGEIKVNNGRYQAYGQDLKIDKGRLIFSGGSIENPSLDLNAEKTIETTTAGVSVSGKASAPRLGLYSTPTLRDEDILAVLIFNKPVGELGSEDGLALLRIANSLRGDGTSTVTKVTQRLQESLGLTNLELQTSNNAPSIVAGKQLSSKLYIGYGYGLLDAAQSLILRYNLNQAWSVKADVGVNSGADLRYQFER